MSAKDYKISVYKSLIPVIFLTFLLLFNILFFENNDWFGDYTFHYIFYSLSSLLIGIMESKVFKIIYTVFKNIKNISLKCLFLVVLLGTWKVNGIIPAMVYYGLDLVSLKALPITLVVSTLVSLTTGSSYNFSHRCIALVTVALLLAYHLE